MHNMKLVPGEESDVDNISEEDVILTVRIFKTQKYADELGFHAQGQDNIEDAVLLEAMTVMIELLGNTKQEMERKLIGNVLMKDRERRKNLNSAHDTFSQVEVAEGAEN